MNELITIKDVRGYLDKNGTAHLNLEDVARGLGFTETKDHKEYIRWRTISAYLNEFEFSQEVAKDGFIPENIFYKLCFKASNEKARNFQNRVTDEILPDIRKHGIYASSIMIEKMMDDPDFAIQLLTNYKEEKQKRRELEKTVQQQKPKVLFADAVETSHTSILIGNLAKLLNQNGLDIGQNRLFNRMREEGYLCSRQGDQYNSPTQRSMDLGLFEVKERTINNPDGSVRITRTTKVTGKGQIYFINKYIGS